MRTKQEIVVDWRTSLPISGPHRCLSTISPNSTPSSAEPLNMGSAADDGLSGRAAPRHRRRGSGKTNTLAHRVAHLIVSGVDPRRILLMTFSRRAASEMNRRVEGICSKVLGAKAGIMTDALTWAGTFHADRRQAAAGIRRADRSAAQLHDP